MRRPDHQKLLMRLKTEVAKHLAEHGGCPPPPRLYALRKTVKRWHEERAEYQRQIDGYSGGVFEQANLNYPRDRIREIDEKLEVISQLDLRTNQERRGISRKAYQRRKPAEYRGLTDTEIQVVERQQSKLVQAMAKRGEEIARQMLIPGSPVRQDYYNDTRRDLLDNLKRFHSRGAAVVARIAVEEKRGELYVPNEYEASAREAFIAELVRLDELDQEFADCVREAELWDAKDHTDATAPLTVIDPYGNECEFEFDKNGTPYLKPQKPLKD